MKKTLLLVALAAVLAIITIMGLMRCSVSPESNNPQNMPPPTEIKWDMEEVSKGPARRAWFEKLHQAEEGVDWKQIEYETAMGKHIQKAQARKSLQKRSQEETFAGGAVVGTWKERGSIDQAGSVIAMDYDIHSDMIYTVGAGGSLWRRSRTINDWTLINDDLRFDNQNLVVISDESEPVILFTAVNGAPHYSLDEGATWIASTGVTTETGAQMIQSHLTKNEAGENQLLILHRSANGAGFKLFLSKDNGVSFTTLTNTGNSDRNNFTIEEIKSSNEIYFYEQRTENTSRLSKWNAETEVYDIITETSPIGFGNNGRVNLEAVKLDETTTRFYIYDEDNMIHSSEDFGQTWQAKGLLVDADSGDENRPWSVGIFVPESAPNVILSGAVDALRSTDGGNNFRYINRWWEYYPDPENKMHADIMWMEDFTTLSGESFVLINNHGGMYISYNNTGLLTNISLEGLNVSQYYDVRTLPLDDNVIFAGAQDQGFQRGYIDGEGAQSFDQLISGDYGHIEFTDDGRSLWTVYPSGLIHFYRDAEFDGTRTAGIQLPIDNSSAWIAPIIADPDPTQNIVYAAGGSIDENTPGSYLIKLEYRNGNIIGENMPYDFSLDGGNITDIEIDPTNENLWYVTSSNGRFYKSTDRGLSFSREASGIPNGHYLYGADILISKQDPNFIMVSGSGYSTPGVRRSTDGGDTWNSAISNLPRTMVFGLTFNKDESLVFAATEAGPYVYVVEANEWHDISGIDVPNQTFWSVEYLEKSDFVRYGTYGRGAWDLELSSTPVSANELSEVSKITIYPNPSSDFISIDIDDYSEQTVVMIYDGMGRFIEKQVGAKNPINIQSYEKGIYHLSIIQGENVSTSSFLKQ